LPKKTLLSDELRHVASALTLEEMRRPLIHFFLELPFLPGLDLATRSSRGA